MKTEVLKTVQLLNSDGYDVTGIDFSIHFPVHATYGHGVEILGKHLIEAGGDFDKGDLEFPYFFREGSYTEAHNRNEVPTLLKLVHKDYVECRNKIPDIRLGSLSVNVACIAYGKASDIDKVSQQIDELEAKYSLSIKLWRKSLMLAEKCLIVREDTCPDKYVQLVLDTP